MDSNGFNLADIKTITDGNSGWGGGNIMFLFLWLALFANGGYGFGGNRGGNCATTEDLASGFNFSSLQSKGNDILAAVNAEGRANENQLCQLGTSLMQQLYSMSQQQADCCCQTQRAIDQVRYDQAMGNCDLKTAIHAEGEATRAMIQQDKIESLQQQVNQLQLNSALCGVVRYPMQTTYGAGYNPFFGGYGCGTNCCTNI